MTPTWDTDLLESVGENFDVNFVMKEWQTIYNLVNKLRTTGLLIDKKTKHKRRVLTEEKFDIGARLEHIPRKLLKRLAQEIGVSKSSARMATQFWSHPVKVGAWCAVSARRIVVCVFLNKTIYCRIYLRVDGLCFQHLLWSVSKDKNFPLFQMLLAY
jgi:hypothetical protein